jgi:hypothetical protein
LGLCITRNIKHHAVLLLVYAGSFLDTTVRALYTASSI